MIRPVNHSFLVIGIFNSSYAKREVMGDMLFYKQKRTSQRTGTGF